MRRLSVLAAASMLAIAATLGGGAPIAGPRAPACTILGTAGADTLEGTAEHDVICGKGGNDTLLGMGGDDVLRGGPGKDTLDGGRGADRLVGGDAEDRFEDFLGADDLFGGGGDDICMTTQDDAPGDHIDGGPGNDGRWNDYGDTHVNTEYLGVPVKRPGFPEGSDP